MPLTNVLRIPKAALRFRLPGLLEARVRMSVIEPPKQGAQPTPVIYVIDEQGRPMPVRVTLGVSDASYIKVVSGSFREGQLVATGAKNRPAKPRI